MQDRSQQNLASLGDQKAVISQINFHLRSEKVARLPYSNLSWFWVISTGFTMRGVPEPHLTFNNIAIRKPW